LLFLLDLSVSHTFYVCGLSYKKENVFTSCKWKYGNPTKTSLLGIAARYQVSGDPQVRKSTPKSTRETLFRGWCLRLGTCLLSANWCDRHCLRVAKGNTQNILICTLFIARSVQNLHLYPFQGRINHKADLVKWLWLMKKEGPIKVNSGGKGDLKS